MTDVAAAWPASTSFVGRAGPLAAVRRCLDDALRGLPRVVVVEGEAGIGKSRLADEVLAVARQQGALVLVGRCGEDLSVPYFPIAARWRHSATSSVRRPRWSTRGRPARSTCWPRSTIARRHR